MKKNFTPTRLFDILDHRTQLHPDRPFFSNKVNGEWIHHSLDEYRKAADSISYALLAMGVQRGENVALISSGRPEWNYIDMGVQQMGAVLVPIYPTISEQDYLYIISHSEVRYIFIESGDLLRRIGNVLPQVPTFKELFSIVPTPGYRSLEEFISFGNEHPNPTLLQQLRDSIQPDDVATMIYTSGTTGTPKGVMLAHCGILANLQGICESPDPSWSRALSWMPMCHIYERMMNYLYQYLGIEVYYAESMAKIADNAYEIRPHMMTAVPRFIEKAYDKIYRKGQKLKGIRHKIFFWALDIGFRYDLDESNLSGWYQFQRRIADRLVFSQIRDNLGDIQMLVSGGASIQPRLTRFFSCVGLNLYEGYGLTECSPLVAVTNSQKGGRRIGSVGFALPGVEVRIDSNTGEIICRGKNVMKGYFKAPDLTAEAIDNEGWFHTGDTGYFDKDGFLFLSGRTKSMFKTAMGKFVNPEVIEERFKESPFILDMMVVGEGEKFAAALIAPDFDFLHEWQLRHGITGCNTHESMVADETTLQRYRRVIDKYNATLGHTEQIKRFCLVTDTWSCSNGMLTPTLKVKRKVVAKHYAEEIAELFK